MCDLTFSRDVDIVFSLHDVSFRAACITLPNSTQYCRVICASHNFSLTVSRAECCPVKNYCVIYNMYAYRQILRSSPSGSEASVSGTWSASRGRRLTTSQPQPPQSSSTRWRCACRLCFYPGLTADSLSYPRSASPGSPSGGMTPSSACPLAPVASPRL